MITHTQILAQNKSCIHTKSIDKSAYNGYTDTINYILLDTWIECMEKSFDSKGTNYKYKEAIFSLWDIEFTEFILPSWYNNCRSVCAE
jgi:ACT domain-containing protein